MTDKVATRDKILEYIEGSGKVRVEDLRRYLNLGRAIIHRHLNKLVASGKVTRVGKPPLVYYVYNAPASQVFSDKDSFVDKKTREFIDKNYLYVSPSGEMIYGLDGFLRWVKEIKQERALFDLAQEYVQTRKGANLSFNKDGVIDATQKIKSTFDRCFVEKLFLADFYSLSKFGKTILGQKVLYSKQAQIPKLVKEVSSQISPLIHKIISKYSIQAVGFIPPTIPRNIQFLKELEYNLDLNLPRIDFTKAYRGDVIVAQKTISKLEERITNARETIFIKGTSTNYKKVLIIDDAVGSGATINETAKKLKSYGVQKVYAFAVVGSIKGFDVIQEV